MNWTESSEAVAVSAINGTFGKQDLNAANLEKSLQKSVPLK